MFYVPWLTSAAKTFSAVLFVLYVVVPVLVKTNPWIFSKILFLHFLKFPYFVDLKRPEKRGIKGCKNFYIKVNEKVTLGAWQTLPGDLLEGDSSQLNSGHPIILYLHGRAGTRAQPHRIELYKVLSSMNFHVIAIDYRGFGDSSGTPTEEGVLEDTYKAYRWIRDRSDKVPLYIWGHSLGSAISTNLLKHLNKKGERVDGLILESPFNNLWDASRRHPMSLPFRFLPWFEWVFIDSMKKVVDYCTEDNIMEIDEPLLILHAADDHIIPVQCGRELHTKVEQYRKGKVGRSYTMYKEFDRHLGYRHCDIYKDPELPTIIRSFMEMCVEKK
ncbi:lysophosphatidylserine lipase ABHD12-like isoform X2 [Mytilus californianus]|uniref:lysophosphatidylserine lipase ABHD12-like isoform X2 n=1 Tax=Mytilus californianus TaxID=6549 RepID=UPI002246E1CF|nr:lysophosphatidylserine lipase ABHD12-like isoform X2 [Mytilus californianus]